MPRVRRRLAAWLKVNWLGADRSTGILVVGALYVASVGVLFVLGLGIPAAYLTMPVGT